MRSPGPLGFPPLLFWKTALLLREGEKAEIPIPTRNFEGDIKTTLVATCQPQWHDPFGFSVVAYENRMRQSRATAGHWKPSSLRDWLFGRTTSWNQEALTSVRVTAAEMRLSSHMDLPVKFGGGLSLPGGIVVAIAPTDFICGITRTTE
jgi:hypothetical protein